ncbi:MAG: hypothetical protein ACRDP6_37175 [Actinoallomurus sp.]
MIQIFFEAILPALILAAFLAALLAALLVVAARLAGHSVALWRAQRRVLAAQTRVFTTARNAIAATITELSSRPATYATFPPDVLALLHDAHTQSALLEMTGDHL